MIGALIRKVANPKAREFGIYLGSTLCTKLIPFLVIPLVTSVLGPSEYGKWALFTALISFALPLAGGTMSVEIWRHYYKETPEARAKTIAHALSLIIISGACLFLLLLPALYFDEILSLPSPVLLMLPVILVLQNIVTMTTKMFRFEKKPKIFAIYEIGQGVLMAVFYSILILGISANWLWFVVAMTVASLVFVVASCVHLFRTYSLKLFRFEKEKLKQMLRVGLPMIPHLIGASFILMIDRIAIERMLSLEAVGIYSVGIMVANALKILVTAIIKVWAPWLMEHLTNLDDDKAKNIAKNTWRAAIALAFAALCLWGVGYMYISYFFDARFHPALSVLPWAIVAFYIQGLYQLFSTHIIFKGETKVLMMITFMVGLVNVVLTIALIYWIGLLGAVVATALSFGLQLLVVFLYVQRDKSIPFFRF